MDLFKLFYPISFDKKNTALISDGNASCIFKVIDPEHIHIIGIVCHPDFRLRGLSKKLVKLLQAKYKYASANVLYTELINLKFWMSLNFKMSENNSDNQYICLEWKNDL